jgi:GTP-binding protein
MIVKFNIPSRGIMDYVINCLLQLLVRLSHRFIGYEPFKGEIAGRNKGSLISMEKEKLFLILLINYKIVESFC